MLDAGGRLDLSFGAAGGVPSTGTVALYTSPTNATGTIGTSAIAVEPGGDIVEAGIDSVGAPGTAPPAGAVRLARLLPGGSQDISFATSPVTISGQGLQVVKGVVVQGDGKIDVLAGNKINGDAPGPTIVLQFDADGQLDTTFGPHGAGYVEVTFGGQAGNPAGIALQSNGQIVVDGTVGIDSSNPPGQSTSPEQYGVARLNTDGSFDTSFGTNGSVVSSFLPGPTPAVSGYSIANALAIQPDGKILVGGVITPAGAGTALTTFAVARLDPAGSPDPSFADAGVQTGMADLNAVTALAVEPDGDIVLAGAYAVNQFQQISFPGVIRLTPSGDVAPTFNAAATHIDGDGPATSLAVAADGKIVITSSTGVSPRFGLDTRLYDIVDRFAATGEPDPTFGHQGGTGVASPDGFPADLSSVAIQPDGKILVGETGGAFSVARLRAGETLGDYTGDGKADVAIYLPSIASFAIRPSQGGPDQIIPFGLAGPGASIATPGDYDGSGKTEISVYMPSLGAFAYRPADGGPDVIIPFGLGGAGASIPAQGDYFGTGQTDLAVYLPSIGAFAIRNPLGGPDEIIPFGLPGAGNSIPVPGDYDNSGRTELAVYLPTLAAFAYRPADGGPDVITRFGLPGKGVSIPVPGDYDGSGKTELAVYFPSTAQLVYLPAVSQEDVAIPFGFAGPGGTIPAPADYTGDGITDVAAYLPSLGVFAYRPSQGGSDFFEAFGLPGVGQSIPVDAPAGTLPTATTVSALSIPLTPDLLSPATHKKAGSTS